MAFSAESFFIKFAEVLTLSGPLSKRAPSDVRSFCEYAIRMLRAAKPRKLNCGFEKKPILLFTDGCWEKGFAGIGAVIVDTAIFFRPTPLGFRQVVQHVQLHVA